ALGGILASVFQKGKMDVKGFLNMMLSIGTSFIPGGGFLKGFLGALRFGEGGSFIPRAAQGLVTAPSMSPGGAIINDNPKTVPETVLTSQELQQLIYGISHPHITIHNANPETYAEALINIPESIKYKLARFMSDEILNKTEALNE
ncbi:hypothetical protein KAX02_08300, partial [candidate division WOR-3 bacterium]|nr:hypothetical protein [candidate division WOR-3 bacterium]